MLFSSHCEKELGLAKYVNDELHVSKNFNRHFVETDWDIIPKKIFFNDEFNYSIENLPEGIEYLRFGQLFNKSLDKLPQSITHIYFGYLAGFDQPINNLPQNLKTLELGFYFTQSLNCLPAKLESLKIVGNFSHTLEYLPVNLKTLVIGNEFNRKIDLLPASITHLTLGDTFNHSVAKLPKSLMYLQLGFEFNKCVNKLPKNLKTIIFGQSFNQAVDKLPNQIKHIAFGSKFSKPLANLPNSVISIKFMESNIPNDIPNFIEEITLFIDGLQNPISNLPVGLKKLTIISYSKKFDVKIKLLKNIPFNCKVYNAGGEDITDQFIV